MEHALEQQLKTKTNVHIIIYILKKRNKVRISRAHQNKEELLYLQNRFLTRAAPTPTNISSNSEPEQKKNGTPASPATALASKVFPVPGEPVKSTPKREPYITFL